MTTSRIVVSVNRRLVSTFLVLFAASCIEPPRAGFVSSEAGEDAADVAVVDASDAPIDESDATRAVDVDVSRGDVRDSDFPTDTTRDVGEDTFAEDATADTADATPDLPSVPLVVAFVVGSAAQPNVSDSGVAEHFRDRGWEVLLYSQDQSADALAAGADLYVISKTISSSVVGNAFYAVAEPVILWETGIQHTGYMGFVSEPAGGMNWLRDLDTFEVDQAAPTKLRGGAAGTLSFYVNGAYEVVTVPGTQLGSGAIVVATAGPDENVSYYAYDRGAMMADLTPAAGKRVMFGMGFDGWENMSDEAKALFGAAVNWATEP